MSTVQYFEDLRKDELPVDVREFIIDQILSDTEGLEALNPQNETLLEVQQLIKEKFPKALGITEEGEEKVDVNTPSMTDEEEKEFILNKLEIMKEILSDLEGEEKEFVQEKIDILEMIVESY